MEIEEAKKLLEENGFIVNKQNQIPTKERNAILLSILGRSQKYPNCKLIQRGMELEIICYNAYSKPKSFFVDVSSKGKEIETYHDNWKFLSENPRLIIFEKN